MKMFLVVSEDVEVNPGPLNQEQVHRMLEVTEMFPNIKMTEALLTQVTATKQKKKTGEEKLLRIL